MYDRELLTVAMHAVLVHHGLMPRVLETYRVMTESREKPQDYEAPSVPIDEPAILDDESPVSIPPNDAYDDSPDENNYSGHIPFVVGAFPSNIGMPAAEVSATDEE